MTRLTRGQLIRDIAVLELKAEQEREQAVWPEGVVARYQTVGGATVDVSGGGDRTYARCTGCGDGRAPGLWWHENIAHERAQAHAETCRAMPKPGGVR